MKRIVCAMLAVVALCGPDAAGAARARYGQPVADPAGIIDLPSGFEYRIVARAGDEMSDGLRVPALPDGMGAFRGPGGTTIVVCNHEATFPRQGAFGTDGARWDEYAASQRKIAKVAADAGANVMLSNHSEYDGAYTKARLVTAKREVGENHPFIAGTDAVQRYFTVMAECAMASKLRLAK